MRAGTSVSQAGATTEVPTWSSGFSLLLVALMAAVAYMQCPSGYYPEDNSQREKRGCHPSPWP
jgi:hypothetical protein